MLPFLDPLAQASNHCTRGPWTLSRNTHVRWQYYVSTFEAACSDRVSMYLHKMCFPSILKKTYWRLCFKITVKVLVLGDVRLFMFVMRETVVWLSTCFTNNRVQDAPITCNRWSWLEFSWRTYQRKPSHNPGAAVSEVGHITGACAIIALITVIGKLGLRKACCRIGAANASSWLETEQIWY